jgi:hypothetical protein
MGEKTLFQHPLILPAKYAMIHPVPVVFGLAPDIHSQ